MIGAHRSGRLLQIKIISAICPFSAPIRNRPLGACGLGVRLHGRRRAAQAALWPKAQEG